MDWATWLYGFAAGALLTFQTMDIIHMVITERDAQ